MIYGVFDVKITWRCVKIGGNDGKRTRFHMNVAIKLHRICTCKTKICESYYYVFHACEKNNFKMYKNVEKGAE